MELATDHLTSTLTTRQQDYAAQFLYDSLEDLGKGGIKVDLTGLTRPAAAQ